MPSVTIDAGVLAAPPASAEKSAVLRYVEALLDWRRLLEAPGDEIRIYMSNRAAEVLESDGLYPLRQSLKALFSQRGVVEYDFNTVSIMVETLLRLTPDFETFFKVTDVLCAEVSTQPDLLAGIGSRTLASDLSRCVVLLVLLRQYCKVPVTDHALVVKPWDGKPMVQVKALVHDLEHTRDDLAAWPHPPDYMEGVVWVCQSFRELVTSLDEAQIWAAAQNDVGRHLALLVGLYKYRLERGLDPEWGDCPAYTYGREFLKRFDEVGGRDMALIASTLHVMCETLDDQNLPATHALRTSNSGGAPQRVRGADKGWRRDINKITHLHYWKGPTGIEFGWLSFPHDDFVLPE